MSSIQSQNRFEVGFAVTSTEMRCNVNWKMSIHVCMYIYVYLGIQVIIFIPKCVPQTHSPSPFLERKMNIFVKVPFEY